MKYTPIALALLVGACTPSINPSLKSAVDNRVASLTAKANVYPRASAALVPAPGAWATLKMTDSKGNLSLITYKLLSVQGDMIDFETVTDSYFDSSVHQMSVRFTSDWRPVEILSYRYKNGDGTIVDMSGPELVFAKKLANQWLPMLTFDASGQGTEDARVLAGTFASCTKSRREVALGPYSVQSTVWLHPAVPFGGTVKSIADNGVTTELVDFGTSGATAQL